MGPSRVKINQRRAKSRRAPPLLYPVKKPRKRAPSSRKAPLIWQRTLPRTLVEGRASALFWPILSVDPTLASCVHALGSTGTSSRQPFVNRIPDTRPILYWIGGFSALYNRAKFTNGQASDILFHPLVTTCSPTPSRRRDKYTLRKSDRWQILLASHRLGPRGEGRPQGRLLYRSRERDDRFEQVEELRLLTIRRRSAARACSPVHRAGVIGPD